MRACILSAATRLIDRAGERAVTLRAVAREADTTTTSLYRHFPGRAAVLSAAVAHGFAGLTLRLRTATITGTDPAADAIALWLGLHGLADQLGATRTIPQATSLVPRLISALAHIS